MKIPKGRRSCFGPLVEIPLLLRYINAGPGILPVHVQGALAAGLIEVDGEVLDGRAGLGNAHRHARQIFAFTWIVRSPLARLLADDERPLVGFGYSEDGVAAGRDVLSANDHRAIRDKSGCLIRAGAPYLAVGNEFAEDRATLRP